MQGLAIGLLFGCVMVLPLTELPHFVLSSSILILAVVFLIYFKINKRNFLSFIFAILAGFLMTASLVDYQQTNSFDASHEGKDLLVRGQIDSLVKLNDFSRSFLFKVDTASLVDEAKPLDWSGLIRLSIYRSPIKVNAGETWQFQVRLKRSSGFMNPGGFDYEKWLFAQGIEAKGYLRKSEQHKRLESAPWYSINSFRESIHRKIKASLDSESSQALVSALILAEKGDISKEQWRILRATGTSHLMAISGLHIGLVASGGLLFVWLLWWCFPSLNLILPRRVAGSMLGVALAVGYALLAGMTIPTQRALIMVVLGLFSLAGKQHFSGYRILALAMMMVLAFNPLAMMNVGFYLSFSAVLIIMWLLKRVIKSGKYSLLSLQGFLSLLMIPLSLLFFGEGSLISPLANIIAIPWVSFVVVPLSMLSVLLSYLSESLAALLFEFLSWHLHAIFALLEFLSKSPMATIESLHLSTSLLVALLLCAVVILVPIGLSWRYVACLALLPMWFFSNNKPLQEGSFLLTVLDVGQGLAVVVETKNHSLVYDTGNRASDSFDLGEMVVVPYLKRQAIETVDAVVISHDDSDHMGGLGAVLEGRDVIQLYGNRLELTEVRENKLCAGGQQWEWDGVKFEFIHPIIDWQGSDNDRSCVMKVSSPEHSVLLTGDIQRKAEKQLLVMHHLRGQSLLDADIMLMPHHGSKTSSRKSFIDAVDPKWAIASAGYRSRFKHPASKVVKRYETMGIKVLNTADSGAIQFYIGGTKKIAEPIEHRPIGRRFWSRKSE